MLSMVGGALKKINGLKDPSMLSSQCQTKKLDYQPTPIHVLKAKLTGSGFEYDPVSNFSASSSHVTLPNSTKRSLSSDTLIPAKRSKIDVNEVEAKFSDSDDERTSSRTSIPAVATVHVTNCSVVSVKSSKGSALQSLSNQPAVKVRRSSDNSALKTLHTNVPVSASSTKFSATQTKPKVSSSSSLTSSKSQVNLTVSCNRLDSTKLPSTASNDDSVTEQFSPSRVATHRDDEQHTDKDCSNFSERSNNCHNKNTGLRNTDSVKTSKSKCHHSSVDNHQSCQSTDATSGKQSNRDGHKLDGSATVTKSDHHHQINSSENSCSVIAGKIVMNSDTLQYSSSKHQENRTHDASDKKDAGFSSHKDRRKEKQSSETHRYSGSKHQENHTHDASEQCDKKDARSSSHRDKREEKQSSEIIGHKSKTSSSGSCSSKDMSSHRHDKEHKTSNHRDSRRQQNDTGDNSHHTKLEAKSHAESCQSKTARNDGSAVSDKESKSSHHKHSKHRHSADMADIERTQPVGSNHLKSSPPKAASNSVSTKADLKHLNTVRNIELFGEDSDTESDFSQMSPVKHRELQPSKSSVSRRTLQSDDEVVLISDDDLSDANDHDNTFQQCQWLYNQLAKQQQSRPTTGTSTSIQNVSYPTAADFAVI